MFIYTNPNPIDKKVGDCVIRAIAIATETTWERAYMGRYSSRGYNYGSYDGGGSYRDGGSSYRGSYDGYDMRQSERR